MMNILSFDSTVRPMSFFVAVDPVGPAVSRGYLCVYWNLTVADIAAIEVAPSHRRQGVGRSLVDAVIAAAVARDRTAILAQTTKTDQDARSFLIACGFAKHYDATGIYDVFAIDPKAKATR